MLTIIGEALVDVVHSNDAPMHAYPGGSPLNVAVGAARLGHKTRFIGHYGTDEHGASIAAHLSASKVQVPFEPRAARTSTAQAYIGEDGAARYEFDIDWSLDSYADDILALAPSCEALHTGSIGAMLEPGAHVVAQALTAARESALISYDPNCRPTIISDRSLAETAHAWLDLGVELMVITRGEVGPIAYTRAYPNGIEEPAYRVEVADTVGAGDSLMAALIAALLDRGISGAQARAKLAALTREDIQNLLRFSATAAGITVSRSGANPPTREELNAVLNG